MMFEFTKGATTTTPTSQPCLAHSNPDLVIGIIQSLQQLRVDLESTPETLVHQETHVAREDIHQQSCSKQTRQMEAANVVDMIAQGGVVNECVRYNQTIPGHQETNGGV